MFHGTRPPEGQMVFGGGVFLLGQETRRVALEWGGRVCIHFLFVWKKKKKRRVWKPNYRNQ